MKNLAKFKFCLTRLVMLLLCLWAFAPQASADVTIWVQANSAPHLYVFGTTGTCTGTVSGTAYSSYTTWSGALMTKNVTTSDNKTWYYEVFEGLNSASIIFNNGNDSQTSDITGVSGTKYFYSNGSNKYIDLTECKNYSAYFFLETNTSYWQPYASGYRVWDGSNNVNMIKVGGTKDGNDIYLYRSNTTPSSTIYIKEMENGSDKNEASTTYGKGYYYLNTGWTSVTYQSNNSLGTIVWPEMPVTSTYTVTGIASPTEGGTVTPASTTDLQSGATVTLTATPANGYQFSGWTISGTSTYTENGSSVTVTVGTSNVNATANFTATPKSYTIHVIDYNGGTPYLYAWYGSNTELNGAWPGAQMTETETSAAGETWYKKTLSTTASAINVIASLGGDGSKTDNIENIAPGDYYIVFDGSTKTIKYQGTTMPSGKQQAEQQAEQKLFTVYVLGDDAQYIYAWSNNQPIGGAWPGTLLINDTTETLADGNTWYKVTYETYEDQINIIFNDGEGGHQGPDIEQTDAVAYYYYNGTTESRRVPAPTGKMYVIGQVGGNPWAANVGTEMTDNEDGTFSLKKVQIISGATFAFATALGSNENDWTGLQQYRLTSTAEGDYWLVTNSMTDKTNPMALALQLWNGNDKNFRMDETAYYDITFDSKTWTVTVTRDYDALYMYYGSHWAPNAGVPMLTADGETYTLANVGLSEASTFQFTKSLGADANTWPADDKRLGANAQGNEWIVTDGQLNVVLENAMLAGSTKDFKMDAGTAGTYRVVVNVKNNTLALYRMAEVLGSKVIIHLEQTSNVESPRFWAYDKERNKDNTDYIHVDRPSRKEVATNRRVFFADNAPNEADTITTADGRKWWTWEVDGGAICDFWFTRNSYDYANNLDDESNVNMTDIQWRRSGEIFLTWPSTGSSLEDYTRDYYAAAAQEAAECAVMIEGHKYAYFTNTPGWEHVFCHAWYTDGEGVNHDLLTPPAPYQGDPTYPGALCELVGYDKDGYEVWRIDLTEVYNAAGVTSDSQVGILFNNGIDDNHNYGHEEGQNHDYATGEATTAAKEQTGDFAYSTGTCYDYCGVIVLGRSLGNIIRNGVLNGPVYTIEDDIVGVWFDENAKTDIVVDGDTYTVYGALYCKDLNNFVTTPYVEKSLQKEGEIDYMLQRTSLMSGKNRYDQSNWVKLTLSTQYPGVLVDGSLMTKDDQLNILSRYVGFVLPAESVRGQLVNNVNPEMRLALQALPESNTVNNYYLDPNVFCTANFVGTQECREQVDEYGHYTRNVYFMVTPKPQEYATITWAVYAGDNKFYVPDRGTFCFVDEQCQWMNEGDLDGYFPVQWDLMNEPDLTECEGQAYRFKAIIRLAEDEQATSSTPAGMTLRDAQQTVPYKLYSGTVPYVVSPIDIQASSPITAVNDVNTAKTVKQVRYYNLAGIESSEPFDGVNVVVTTYTDGSKTASKELR